MEDQMEQVIHGLLGQYEHGALSRRELIGALAILTATGQSASAAGFESNSLNHVAIVVSDLRKSAEFYQRVCGLSSVLYEDKASEQINLGLGKSHISLRHLNGATGVDHIAIGLNRFDRASVIADLKARGATPIDQGDYAGLHVRDPDGIRVQFIKNDVA
jgi:catechol 2,3-dioxygenase-like lactoylglutathione lyase family enzyme